MNSKTRAGLLSLTLAALLCAPALLAQEMPGGAPGAPTPPWWPQPEPKKVRVPQRAEAKPAPAIAWANRSQTTLKRAAESQTPILICFLRSSENADATRLSELADKFILVRVFLGDSADEPATAGAPDPWTLRSAFLTADAATAYNVPAGRDSYGWCDWHGNLHTLSADLMSDSALESWLRQLPEKIAKLRTSMQANNTQAATALAQGKRRAAIGWWIKVLKQGYWGYPEVTEAADMLQRQLKDGLRECEAAQRSGDKEAMMRLQADFKGSPIADRITRLLAKMQAPEQEEAF